MSTDALAPWVLAMPGHQQWWYRLRFWKIWLSLFPWLWWWILSTFLPLTHLPWGDVTILASGRYRSNSKRSGYNFQTSYTDLYLGLLLWNCFKVNVTEYLPNEKSTLVQVMAWCRQATRHYLSQCWPRSVSPYGITRPQWFDHTTDWWGMSIVKLIMFHMYHCFISSQTINNV